MVTAEKLSVGFKKVRPFMQFLLLLNALVGVFLHGWRAPASTHSDATSALVGSHS